MKKNFIVAASLLMTANLFAQEEVAKDSLKIQQLDEVLVETQRVKAEDPFTYSNLSKEEIEKRNLGQDLPILMNFMPSVVTTSDAGTGIGYTGMRVRGSDASRINVTVNGIPYNDSESHGTYWVNMGDFASSTESIQLQRGVGTSTNGAGAFGASLNILTDHSSEKANGEISNSVGSFNTRKHTVKYATGRLNDHFELSGRMSNIHSDGYVDRASTDLNSYFLQGSYTDNNTLIKALVFGGKEKTYQSWYGLNMDQLKEDRTQNPYTYENETDNYQQNHYQLHINQKLTDRLAAKIGLNYTKGAGYYEQYKAEKSAADFANLIEEGSDAIVRRWLDNNFYVMNATLTYKKQHLEIVGGSSSSYYQGDHFGEIIWGSDLAEGTQIRDNYYFNDAVKTDNSVFAKATFNIIPKLRAYVDLQGRFIEYTTNGVDNDQSSIAIDDSFNFFNPKAGLTYTVNNKNSVYGSFARANREPNRSDMIAGTVTHETLNDFELGWRFKNKTVKLNANAYYMGYKNQLVLTGAIDDVGAAIRKNSGKSYRAGIELDATVNLNKVIIQPNITLSQNKNVDFNAEINGVVTNLGDTEISFSPSIIAGNTITYIPVKNLQVSLLSKYVGEQRMSNLDGAVTGVASWGVPYDDHLEAYFVTDLNVSYEFKPKKVFTSIIVTGLVNNIFSEEYVSNGYFGWDYDWYSGYYPQATRNFLVGATLKF